MYRTRDGEKVYYAWRRYKGIERRNGALWPELSRVSLQGESLAECQKEASSEPQFVVVMKVVREGPGR